MGCCSKGVGTESDEKKEFDPKFRGPIEDRSCRDVFMILIYVAFWVGLFLVALFGVQAGDPYRLLNGADSFGNTCGRDNTNYKGELKVPYPISVNAGLDLRGYDKLLNFNVLNGNSLKLCVAACPTATAEWVTKESGFCLNGNVSELLANSVAAGQTAAAVAALAAGAGEAEEASATGVAVFDPSTASAEEIAAANATAVAAAAALTAQIALIAEFEASQKAFNDAAAAAAGEAGEAPGNETSVVASNPYYTDIAQWKLAYHVNTVNGCPLKVRASLTMMNRCIPAGDNAGGAVTGMLDTLNAGGIAQDFISDTQKAYVGLIIILAATLVVAIIFVCLLRWFAFVMIWIAYWALTLGSAGLIGWLWYMWWEKDENYKATLLAYGTTTASQKSDVDTFFVLSIVWSIVGGILFIVLVFMYNRIALVVALFKEAGKAIKAMPFILFYPLLTLISGAVCVGYFLMVALYLFSAGIEVHDTVTDHISFKKDTVYQYMSLYHLFGFYWSWEFTMAFQETVLAGCAATWYFTRDKKDLSYTVSNSVWRTIRYHLGSVLFGALIIAIIKLIRFLLSYVEKKAKVMTERSTAAKFVLKCVGCCLWCCEKCMKFINRNAYIQIAIYGKNFCRSAWAAFAILMRNALRVAAINSVGDLVLMMAKLVITAVGTFAAFAYFQYQDRLSSTLDDAGAGAGAASTVLTDNVQYASLQIVLCALLSYFLATMFVGVYEMLIDTIFICFAEDAERNDGSDAKPFFMSKNLLKFMSAEEKRTQARTEKQAQHAQKKADAASAQHKSAMSLNIDSNGSQPE